MIDFPILAISFFWNLIAVLFVICCVVLILIILVQKGKGGGLSSAFGGGTSGGILGTKTGDFLTWVTIVLVCVMLLFAVLLAKYYKPTPTEIPGAMGTTTSQVPPVMPQTSTSGASSSDNGVSGAPVTMIEESDFVEPETSAEVTTNTEETSDSNQTGN
ncbi:MAG: preprotein translocase subunit SecG [Sedimentisphaerales bacterium]|nr:preprotein translocase subunit SecG [Sedimentisphaerales bacterium]